MSVRFLANEDIGMNGIVGREMGRERELKVRYSSKLMTEF